MKLKTKISKIFWHVSKDILSIFKQQYIPHPNFALLTNNKSFVIIVIYMGMPLLGMFLIKSSIRRISWTMNKMSLTKKQATCWLDLPANESRKERGERACERTNEQTNERTNVKTISLKLLCEKEQRNMWKKSKENLQKRWFPAYFRPKKKFFSKIGLGHVLGATSIFNPVTLNGKRPLVFKHTYPPS